MNYLQAVRFICADYLKSLAKATKPAERYLLIYQVMDEVKREMCEKYPHVAKREWIAEISKILGYTPQTLYRSRAAAACFLYPDDRKVSNYCRYSYNTMRQQILGEKKTRLNKN